MSQNPEVKLARNSELAFIEAHLTDLKPESCIQRYFFVICQETAELLVTVYFLPRDAMHERGLCRHTESVCLSVRVCVCHVRELRQKE